MLSVELRNEIKEALREILVEGQDEMIAELDDRVSELEDMLEELPKFQDSIKELDELLKMINRTNKELLYVLSKKHLMENKEE